MLKTYFKTYLWAQEFLFIFKMELKASKQQQVSQKQLQYNIIMIEKCLLRLTKIHLVIQWFTQF